MLFIFIICINYPMISEAIVGGTPAKVPPPDDPVVFVSRHGHNARITGVRNGPYYEFKRLRYAKPPIKLNRFQRPLTNVLEGNINATIMGDPCPQLKYNEIFKNYSLIGNEDCLFLNVYTPELPDGGEGLPVIVWIHGGDFKKGSTSQYGVTPLLDKKVVVVTIQYRLGSLGFLSSGSKVQSGNAALFDISLSLRWVRDYISFFGGNPRQVTTMGHGSGASCAVLLAMSKLAKGFLHGIIAMSGTALNQWSIDNEPLTNAQMLAEKQKCPTTPHLAMVKCLQSLPVDDIIMTDMEIEKNKKTTLNIESTIANLLHSGPVVEGTDDERYLPNFLVEKPLQSLQTGNFLKVPLLTGVTKDETASKILGEFKTELIKKITSIPKYLEEEFVLNLQKFADILKPGFNVVKAPIDISKNVFKNTITNENILPSYHLINNIANTTTNTLNIISNAFTNYLKLKNSNDINEVLQKIIEVTVDALHNLPTYLTAKLWSQSGVPTYLYRFEFKGNLSNDIYSDHTDKNLINNTFVNHGEELPYLFDLNNEKPEKDEFSDDEQKIRDFLTSMVTDFAKQTNSSEKNSLHEEFSSNADNYLAINTNVKNTDGFRFCELGLWCGLTERLTDPSCQFLSVIDSSMDSSKQAVVQTVNNLNKFTDISNTEILKENEKKTIDTKIINANQYIPKSKSFMAVPHFKIG